MNTDKLLPCPFCGASDAFVERKDYSSAYVQCNNCIAGGPVEDQESDDEEMPGAGAAITAWNRRCSSSPGESKPVAVVDEDDSGQWAEILPDVTVSVGQKLYAAPHPTPDVSALVEALARCRQQASYTIGNEVALSDQMHKVREIANEALAAYRQGGEE